MDKRYLRRVTPEAGFRSRPPGRQPNDGHLLFLASHNPKLNQRAANRLKAALGDDDGGIEHEMQLSISARNGRAYLAALAALAASRALWR